MVGARDVKIGGGDLFGWLCQTSAKRPAEVIQAKKRDSEAKKLVWDFVARAPACELCSEEELRAFWARAQHLDKADRGVVDNPVARVPTARPKALPVAALFYYYFSPQGAVLWDLPRTETPMSSVTSP
ncbi:unnamed protein product [Effrenium voratum]|nr:unnamed protein product [Effrenium voratum]